MMHQIWDGPVYIMAKARAKEPKKPKTPTPRGRAAALLVSIGQGESPSPGSEYVRLRRERLEEKWPATPDSEKVEVNSVARPESINNTQSNPPNLGPNTPDYKAQRFGLLDFRDIALFLWPPYRQRKRAFTTNEQCLILKYRNATLIDLMQVELVEVQAWMEGSETITVEENDVNMRHWRINLDEENLGVLVKRMEEDLKQARSILTYTKPTPPEPSSEEKPVEMATPPKTPPQGMLVEKNRSQRLGARRRIEDLLGRHVDEAATGKTPWQARESTYRHEL